VDSHLFDRQLLCRFGLLEPGALSESTCMSMPAGPSRRYACPDILSCRKSYTRGLGAIVGESCWTARNPG